MNSLVFLIPLSILLLVGAGFALFWAVDHGQFEDMDTPALLPMLDDDRAAGDSSHEGPANAASSDTAETQP
jgi:cbb3-type cytochrome oxidase maturation protein